MPEQSCASHETNLPTTEKSRTLTINRASVPGVRAIGGGLSPINKNSRAEQICIPPEKYSVFPPRTCQTPIVDAR